MDPLHLPNGPMTRSKTKALKETLNALVLKIPTKSDLKGSSILEAESKEKGYCPTEVQCSFQSQTTKG